MSRLSGVVFDCDGVLVDSEPHSVTAWMRVLGDLGHPATAGDVESCIGLGFAPTRDVLARLGPLPPADDLWPPLLTALEASFQAGLVVFEDALHLIDRCQREAIALAVVSASPRQRLDLTLASAGLTAVFETSVAGDEVAAGKPAPDGYLAAARELGLDPRDCLAIEDSPTGVMSASSAGMTVVAVDRLGRSDDLRAAGPDIIVDRLVDDVLDR